MTPDEIAAERKAVQDYREERRRQKRLAPLMRMLVKAFNRPGVPMSVVSTTMKRLLRESREITPEAIYDHLGSDNVRSAMTMPIVAAALEALKLTGNYDRIVAEAEADEDVTRVA
jgi:hypothetical protein